MPQHEVLCPLPGTFYRRPAPDKPMFVEEGAAIAAGAVIGLVEVMKQFSEVQADVGGKVVRFLADNESPVEPGQPLLLIETA
jgi:acetyl-CoA carboxylase biotin carboxyl carrier protein